MSSRADPDGSVLLLQLAADPPSPIDLRQFVIGRRHGRCIDRPRPGDLLDAAGLPPGHLADERGILIVGVTPQRRLGEPQRRALNTGLLGLDREGRQRLGFTADQVPGHDQPLAAHDGEEQPIARAGVASQFREEGVVGLGGGRRHGKLDRLLAGRVGDRDFERGVLERTLDEHHRFAIGPQRRHHGRQHPHRGVGGLA